jgi:hypothetical protein
VDIAAVAREGLVAAVAGERHGHMLARHLGHEVGRHGRGIGQRLVVEPRERVHRQARIRLEHLGVVARPDPGRRTARRVELVVALLAEAHRARDHRFLRRTRHAVDHRGRVDAARQKSPQRNVGHQPIAHAAVEPFEDLLVQRRLALHLAQPVARQVPVAPDARLAARTPGQHAPRGEATNAGPGALLTPDVALNEVVQQLFGCEATLDAAPREQ